MKNAALPFVRRRVLPRARSFLRNIKTLAVLQGQWRSIREHTALDKNGAPIPWYTYPATEYLNSFDFTDSDVFEFGSGNSSLYWAQRANSVTSVEDDETWHCEIKENSLSSNLNFLHRPDKTSYTRAINEESRLFDVIVIDGKWRQQCVELAPSSLKPGGIIILDNSDRAIETRCATWLRNQGFFQIDFSGFGPINGYCWSTSLFLQRKQIEDGNLQRDFKGPSPIGGLRSD
jgi:hypothetical protein